MENNRKMNPNGLLFWPVFVLKYLLVEQYHPAYQYHVIECSMDDLIPFLEIFLIPYVLWYFCMAGTHFWLYMRNDPAFIWYTRYLIITTLISTTVFLLYPTCQELRPMVFPRENRLTDAVKLLYRLDTCTNVCPSEHVIGSAGFFLAVHYSDAVTGKKWIAAAVTALTTALSTVFLKQHSVLDILAAAPVCLTGWYTAFSAKCTKGHRTGIIWYFLQRKQDF